MFHNIPKPILDRMQALEEIDARDRQDGTPNIKRLRQVPPETGKMLAFLAAGAPTNGAWLEIGTSAGYSALWLSLAARAANKQLITFELLPDKAALAKETFKKAKVGGVVELVNGDARGHISDYAEIAFCFVDCEKEMYQEVYERVFPHIIIGGLLIFDNVTSHKDALQDTLDEILNNPVFDSVTIPVGRGLLACRKITI